MDRRIALVTGANSGIGRAVAMALAGHGERVVLAGRNEAGLEDARVEITQRTGNRPSVLRVDFTRLGSVREAADRFADTHERLDILVNAAGHTFLERARTQDGLEANFGVNVLGPFVLTTQLEPLLQHSFDGRVVDLAGIYALRGALDVDDLFFEKRGFDPWAMANTSQLARVMLVEERAHRLPPNVTINAVHPGAVLTQAQRGLPLYARLLIHTILRPGFHRPAYGAAPVVHLATTPSLRSVRGRFFRRFKPLDLHHDPAVTGALWARCLELGDVAPRAGRDRPAPSTPRLAPSRAAHGG